MASSAPTASRRPTRAALSLALAVSLGTAAGIGAYTFRYAEGLSYLSTDPRACVNCHIMQPEYDAWQKASHHTVAVCVDCHLPRDFFPKYLAKLENGWRHGKKFTTQRFVEPIVVRSEGLSILQGNCLGCHGDLVHDLVSTDAGDAGVPCVHCHSSVGHGEKAGLGGPLTRQERGGP